MAKLDADILGWLPNAAIVALVSWGIVTSGDPANSERPPEKPNAHRLITTTKEMKAQLWEDPISARDEASEEVTDNAALLKNPGDSVQNRAGNGSLSLFVILGNGTRGDVVEDRIRTRQAVVDALIRAEYKPLKDDELGVLRLDSLDPTQASKNDSAQPGQAQDVAGIRECLQRSIPFEVYEPYPLLDLGDDHNRNLLNDYGRQYDHIYVFYLNADTAEAMVSYFDSPKHSPWSGPQTAYFKALRQELSRNWEGQPDDDPLGPPKAALPPPAIWELQKLAEQNPLSFAIELLGLRMEYNKSDDPSQNPNDTLSHNRMALIGPPSSDDLVKLLAIPPRLNTPFSILSPWTTVDNKIIQLRVGNVGPRAAEMRSTDSGQKNPTLDTWCNCNTQNGFILKRLLPAGILKDSRTTFSLTTFQDHTLADALLSELQLRGLELKDPWQGIALVTEGDSVYGRAFQLSFLEDLEERISPIGDQTKGVSPRRYAPEFFDPIDNDEPSVHVQPFFYLRGLDGRRPNADTGQNQERQELDQIHSIDAKETEQAHSQTEWRPLGNNQYDSVTRLAASLRTVDEQLRWESPSSWHPVGIVAVGLVGDDVYDKLVLLKVLRQALPEATFFTTDMDQSLLTRENIEETRGLIVASAYGTSLRSEIQGPTAPFRSSYQTGVYFSTLEACNFFRLYQQWLRATQIDLNRRGAGQGKTRYQTALDCYKEPASFAPDAPTDPLIFDLSSKGAINLDLAIGDASKRVSPDFEINNPDVRIGNLPRSWSWALARSWTWASPDFANLLKIGLYAPLLLVLYWALAHLRSTQPSNFTFGCVAFLAAVYLVATVTVVVHLPGQEPWGWFNGASAWPSELIRFCAIILGCYYFGAAEKRLRQTAKHCREHPILTMGKALEWRNNIHSPPPSCLPRIECWGIPAIALILILIDVGIFIGCGIPATPVRGVLSRSIDFTLVGFAVVVFNLLAAQAIWYNNPWTQRNLLDPPPDSLYRSGHWSKTILTVAGSYTAELGRLIIYPFTIILLLLVARNKVIAPWHFMPLPLICVFAASVVGIIAVHFSLRYCCRLSFAEHIEMLEASSRKATDEDWREGAFSSVLANPVFRGLLVPLSGTTFLVLVEYCKAIF